MSWAELKKINSDFSKSLDALVKEEIKALDTKIGNSTDIATSGGPSVFNMLKYITGFVANWTLARAQKIDQIRASTLINYGSVIKSIQRGVANAPNATQQVVITINSVVTNKSFVLLNGYGNGYENGTMAYYMPVVSPSFTATSLTLNLYGSSSANVKNGYCNWQVIEFY